MHTIGFYQQERLDGGLRIGMGIDNVETFHHFREGSQEYDPVLLWYVDLIFEGEELPTEPEAARRWLLEQRGPIVRGLSDLAMDLKLGVDANDARPLQRILTGLKGGVEGRMSISALQRLRPGDLASNLTRLAKTWSKTIDILGAMSEAADAR